ncbi:MAG: hypothetical protein ACLTK0_10215 [Anaerovoracaceae bacterium]
MGLIERVKEDGSSSLLSFQIFREWKTSSAIWTSVTGTEVGVTAIQMDIKVHGLSREILEKALNQAKEGRMYIMGKMLKKSRLMASFPSTLML